MGNGLVNAYEMTIRIGRPGCELIIIPQEHRLDKKSVLTTLPALAVTSKSDDRLVRVTFTEANREAVNRGRSLRHSVARALIIAIVMRSDLNIQVKRDVS